jgi:membrane-associated phospholipid phosphatase
MALALALAGSTSMISRSARADAPTPDAKVDEHRLKWTYPRFRAAEYAAALAVTGANIYLQYGTTREPNGPWNNGILFDDGIRNALRSRNAATRSRVGQISDYFWHGTQYFPLVVDSLIVPLVTDRGNTDVAWQMTLLDWQVESLAFFITRGCHRTVGRARPGLQECGRDPGYDHDCYQDESAHDSFLSGHSSMAFAGAALTCAHHRHLPLYGGNAADVAACALTLATATTTGVLRIVADRHWSTDVMSGALVGLATGYGLPYLLHYQFDERGLGAHTAIVPLATGDAWGLSVMGQL